MIESVLWWALAAVCVGGALVVVTTRELTRLLLGLGAFLLGIAGFYAYYGFQLLAVAELFVYVGGVLVLFVFAITAMGRDALGQSIERRLDIASFAVSAGFVGTLMLALSIVPPTDIPGAAANIETTADTLLGALLPHFEVLGVVLLIALVAALAIVAGGDGE